jgi:hypothetical protein
MKFVEKMETDLAFRQKVSKYLAISMMVLAVVNTAVIAYLWTNITES